MFATVTPFWWIHDGAERYAAYPTPELVLISDIHGDHMDPPPLSGLDLSKASIIAPKAAMERIAG
ncbi:MAG: hypothetical protein IPO87_05540 [Flavobacteriales bacterium]|nr:hypothetical protein [Flavobacteriales bacterium]